VTNSVSIGDGSLLDLARQLQRMRAKAAKLFPRDVFRDSAWDMVLELFIAGQQQRVVCVKELIFVSGETSTSALRRIDRLEAAELLHRWGDPPPTTERRARGADRARHALHSPPPSPS